MATLDAPRGGLEVKGIHLKMLEVFRLMSVKKKTTHHDPRLGGGFIFFIFSPLKLGNLSNLTHIFQMG